MAFTVTTPIYYVNAAPHLGHAYTTIAADVLARHHRQRGEDVFFLTGTDEHGEPVAEAAAAQGLTPRELVDLNAPRFEALTGTLAASNDFFVRTSDPRHVAAVQEVLTRVKEAGHVYEGLWEGLYCPRCADFKGEDEIGEGETCLIHGIALRREHERNWFFRLSAFQEPLEALYAQRPDWVTPAGRRNEALQFIRSGLRDVSLSRSQISWGVPVPWDPEQVFYVWWDALLNYATALRFAADDDLTAGHWPPSVQIIGKDILKFHAVYWPALLMAAGLELPARLHVHGFLLVGGEKMSKSRGNVLDPFAAIDELGLDALRFYLFREVSFGQDGSVSMDGLRGRYESELADQFGNLASRSLAMVRRYRDGVPPPVEADPDLRPELDGLAARVGALLDDVAIDRALDAIWEAVRRLNRYVEEQAPWTLAKTAAGEGEEAAEAAARLDVVLVTLIEGVRVCAVLLHPWMPGTVATLLAALGEDGPDALALGGARLGAGGGAAVGELAPLFPKDRVAA